MATATESVGEVVLKFLPQPSKRATLVASVCAENLRLRKWARALLARCGRLELENNCLMAQVQMYRKQEEKGRPA